MKVLLIEDDSNKEREIRNHIVNKGIPNEKIETAKNLSDIAKFNCNEIGLYVIDLNVPVCNGSNNFANGKDVLEFVKNHKSYDSKLIAISSHPEDFNDLRDDFDHIGCMLFDRKNKNSWKTNLDLLIQQMKHKILYDFIIFCALHEEKKPYLQLANEVSIGDTRHGLNCQDITIGNKRGTIISIPRMGLVDAATISATAISMYHPKIIGMSGICAGFGNNAHLGQVIVAEMSYEFFYGKRTEGRHQPEPYQEKISNDIRLYIEKTISDTNILTDIEKDFTGNNRPSTRNHPTIGNFVSFPFVVADAELKQLVLDLHRRTHALDMEVFSVMRSAALSEAKPICLCAKTIVDLADENKDDSLHEYGSYVSASLLVKLISEF